MTLNCKLIPLKGKVLISFDENYNSFNEKIYKFSPKLSHEPLTDPQMVSTDPFGVHGPLVENPWSNLMTLISHLWDFKLFSYRGIHIMEND